VFILSPRKKLISCWLARQSCTGSLARQFCPAVLPGNLARQSCPAVLPGSLARLSCPVVLPGSLARQSCPAVLPGSLARHSCPALLPGSLARQSYTIGKTQLHQLTMMAILCLFERKRRRKLPINFRRSGSEFIILRIPKTEKWPFWI
jgi:hypothetical protein